MPHGFRRFLLLEFCRYLTGLEKHHEKNLSQHIKKTVSPPTDPYQRNKWSGSVSDGRKALNGRSVLYRFGPRKDLLQCCYTCTFSCVCLPWCSEISGGTVPCIQYWLWQRRLSSWVKSVPWFKRFPIGSHALLPIWCNTLRMACSTRYAPDAKRGWIGNTQTFVIGADRSYVGTKSMTQKFWFPIHPSKKVSPFPQLTHKEVCKKGEREKWTATRLAREYGKPA